MRKIIFLLLFMSCGILAGCTTKEKTQDFKVLQINIWHQTLTVPGGFSGLVSIIQQTDPDVVLLSESGGSNKNFIPQLLDTLKSLNKTYYGQTTNYSAGFISKYKIDSQQECCHTQRNGPIIKSYITVAGNTLAVYSAHLDYMHYECYMPRGYSGETWKKLDAPVLDADSVLRANRKSQRDEAITLFVEEAKAEIAKGNLILIGGDFNEPSHMDWQADTKDLRDHNGMVINWDCSVMLTDMGMKDSYRELYPDAVKYPGFTFPSANSSVDVKKLAWAPEADERDRIDFVYYYPNPLWTLTSASIVGPEETIVEGKVKEKDSEDSFIIPNGIWPTDHKANLVTFKIKEKEVK
ncbi:endonuclease/exonuclease/phosphatase family protein [Prevotella sp. 10(H)]|uniref:endonuclease/exonuclease/phosphatase family protein n=1 Tax=Prevotella sp. 10(H) TaxID=1158294 RepID=UPI0004A6F943|nr:endonuclease/exonuclease/phosphatase family protein [Prevotella sp. 10(H)]